MFNSNNNDYVKLDEISPDVINAIVSIEDKNFYKHKLINFFEKKQKLTSLEKCCTIALLKSCVSGTALAT